MFALALAGCGTATKTDTSKPKQDDSTAKTETAGAKSPTETMVAFVEALKKNDNAVIKNILSKSALAELEKAAAMDNKTLDEMITDGKDLSDEKMPEMKNEKIDGDSATLEVEDERSKKWQTVPFVKEDGIWKIALDKMKM